MTFEPSEAQAAVAAMARQFAKERIAPEAARNDKEGRFPAHLVREMGALGLLAINVPAEQGGSEAGAVASALAMMEIAAADRSMAVVAGVTNMVAETINRYGTPEQKARCLPRLASGEWLAGAFGLSEPAAGSDPAAMRTRAERRGEGWVLNGEKQWISQGDVAGVTVVWARTDPAPGSRSISAFLVEQGTPGLAVGRHEEKMGIRASPTVSLVFEDCALPASALLGGTGQGLAIARHVVEQHGGSLRFETELGQGTTFHVRLPVAAAAPARGAA